MKGLEDDSLNTEDDHQNLNNMARKNNGGDGKFNTKINESMNSS